MELTQYRISEKQKIDSVKTCFGRNMRFWDDDHGPLWLYRETKGVLGVVRAETYERAWQCVIDEILDDADPADMKKHAGERGELPEHLHWRAKGVPMSDEIDSLLAVEDTKGSLLELLTEEDAEEYGIVIELKVKP